MRKRELENRLWEIWEWYKEVRMNAKQAAREAAKKIEEYERIMLLNKLDIIAYNKCILSMIDGKTPCDYCEDIGECQLEAKGGKGCGEWMLKLNPVTQADVNGGDADAGETIHGAGEDSGART